MTSSGCLLEALGSLLSPRSTGLTPALSAKPFSSCRARQAKAGEGGALWEFTFKGDIPGLNLSKGHNGVKRR